RLLSARQETSGLNDMLFSGAMALYPAPKISASPSTLRDSTLTDSAITALAAPFGNAYSKTHLLNQSLKVFDRTFLLTDGLNITTLVVAGIAFAVSLTVLALGNAPQLNTLRALGVSRLQVKSALFTQYFLLCLVTAILAIPFGIFLAYVFIVMVNRYAFNWVYPIVIQTEVIMSSVMLSLAIVSLVLLLPLGKLEPKVDLRQEVQL
ncbi:MAG: ABC transporter permease, partial [Pseudomonadota bacterium]